MSRRTARRRLIAVDELQTRLADFGWTNAVPLLVFRVPDLPEIAWRDGKRAAQRLERRIALALRDAAGRAIRGADELVHDPGSDWFAIALFAPARDGAFVASLHARALLERTAAATALITGRTVETGWWPIASQEDSTDIGATVGRALERGSRERERREFLAMVGHELRTPLTSIRGYIETLLDEDVDPAATRRFLETARREALRLGRLVDGMLEFSLLDLSPPPALDSCDLQDQVDAAADALVPMARDRDVTIERCAAQKARIRLDADSCMHLALNLVQNAVKHGNRSGRVRTAVLRRETMAELVVEDDGPGIAAAERDAIFDRGIRGSGVTAPGSGIGLSLVKRIVERAGGSIQVDRSPLGGARFLLSLPLVAATEAESRHSAS